MNLVVNNVNIFIIIFVTFLVSAILIPFAKKIAFHVNALDIPNARKVHAKPMPRLGGLAIFGSFIAGYVFFAQSLSQMVSILLGGFLIIIIGMIDDINPVKARYKFSVQVLAAAIVVYYGGIYFNELTILGYVLDFGYVINSLLSIFFIVAITNAINLIDGLDGLAGGISSIYFSTIIIIAVILGQITGLEVMLSLIMLGSILGYLLYNFPPASIFMGDSGSNFIGFMIAIVALLGYKAATLTSLVVPVLILAIPILDTVLAIGRRVLKGESIGAPDKEHLHHQLLKMKFSTKTTVLTIYLINIMFSSISVFYIIGDQQLAIAIYIILMILLLFLVLKTNILFDHDKKKKLK